VTIDVLLEDPARGRYSVWTQNGGKKVDVDLLQLCRSVAAEGAGEIVINSIDREGSMQGFDLDLAKRLTAELDMPMTFVGGCGKVADMSALIDAVGVVGVGVGSLFVFKGPFRAVLISYAKP
jgi:cyclase